MGGGGHGPGVHRSLAALVQSGWTATLQVCMQGERGPLTSLYRTAHVCIGYRYYMAVHNICK